MKLKLANEKNIAILDILEDVSPQNVAVLRAGIVKLLQSGRDKIIINFAEAKGLDVAIITEILKLHLLATELRGSITMVGRGDLVVQAARALPSPAGIRHYPTKEQALAALAEAQAAQPAPVENYAVGDDANGKLKQKLAQLQAENKALKAKAGTINGEEIRKLRFENGVFSQQAVALEEHIQAIRREKRKPFTLANVDAKVRILEDALSALLKEEGLIPKG